MIAAAGTMEPGKSVVAAGKMGPSKLVAELGSSAVELGSSAVEVVGSSVGSFVVVVVAGKIVVGVVGKLAGS